MVAKPVDTENNNNVISHQLSLKSEILFSSSDVSKTTAYFISKETQTSENICDGLSPDYALKYAALSYLERSQ